MKKYIFLTILVNILFSCVQINDLEKEDNIKAVSMVPVLGARLLKLNTATQQIEYVEQNKKTSSIYTEVYKYSCDFPGNKVIQQEFSRSEENKKVFDLKQSIVYSEMSKPKLSNNSDQTISDYTYNDKGYLESYTLRLKNDIQKVIYSLKFEYDEYNHVRAMQDQYTRIEFRYSLSENFRSWTTYYHSDAEIKSNQPITLIQLLSGINEHDWTYLYTNIQRPGRLESRSNQWIPMTRTYASYDLKLNNPYTSLNYGFKGNENIAFPITSNLLKSYKIYETDENGNEMNIMIERDVQVIKSQSYYPFNAIGKAIHYEYDENGNQSIRASESAIINWKYQYGCNDQL